MKDIELMSTSEILAAIGRSLETMRLEAQIPDSEVVRRGGIKEASWKNLKSGKNVTLLNLIKALKGLEKLRILDPLVRHIPVTSPIDLAGGGSPNLKRRIRKKTELNETGIYQWDDEK